MKTITAVAMALTLAGCTTVSKEDSAVQLHRSNSTVIANCEKLGPVSASGMDRDAAENKLKQQAREKYGADSVVTISGSANMWAWNSVTVQGTALKCWKAAAVLK